MSYQRSGCGRHVRRGLPSLLNHRWTLGGWSQPGGEREGELGGEEFLSLKQPTLPTWNWRVCVAGFHIHLVLHSSVWCIHPLRGDRRQRWRGGCGGNSNGVGSDGEPFLNVMDNGDGHGKLGN